MSFVKLHFCCHNTFQFLFTIFLKIRTYFSVVVPHQTTIFESISNPEPVSENTRKLNRNGNNTNDSTFVISVAKRTSVFDDPTMEIQELTAVIKQDITALNSAVVDLQLVCNSQNSNENVSSDTTTHSTTVVDNLKNRLMSTTKEFKEVLTMRTEVCSLIIFGHIF